jgi:mannose-6-phosphate isomerase
VCVPAGTLHAILDGLLIAEIQQNSNTTYRVYDWNRLGKDGKPRPLHVDKALDVINFQQVAPTKGAMTLVADEAGVRRFQLCHNRYFTVERVELAAGAVFTGACDGSTLEIWGAIDGQARVTSAAEPVSLSAVQFTLLPAALGSFTISAETPTTLLRTYVAQ